jgi:hypothetical protein
MPRPPDASPSAKQAVLNSWEAGIFPSWTLWGRTTIHVYNICEIDVTVTIQTGVAPPAMLHLNAGEDHREYGFYAGAAITITNATHPDILDDPPRQPQIEVWVW